MFSDSCPGQNRNHTLVRFLMSLTIIQRFRVVNVYFPVRGHSFLPCDRDFGVIKRVIRRLDRIYSPEEYNNIIRTAKKKQPLFEVKPIESEQIRDFKNWWPTFFKKTSTSVRSRPKQSFKISMYKHLIFKEEENGYLTGHASIDGINVDIFKLFKGGNLMLPTEKAYSGKVPIKSKKIEDVSKVMHYIPDQYREFYGNISLWPVTNAQGDIEDSE